MLQTAHQKNETGTAITRRQAMPFMLRPCGQKLVPDHRANLDRDMVELLRGLIGWRDKGDLCPHVSSQFLQR